jgi:hypothetical protein
MFVISFKCYSVLALIIPAAIPQFVVSAACGNLPTNIGIPSGGSLTADQWLLLSTIYSGSHNCPNVCMFFTKVNNP